jgi:hypothetical protein
MEEFMSNNNSNASHGSIDIEATKPREGSFSSSKADVASETDQPQYQVAPGNYRVEQAGKIVGILFVFQEKNEFIRYEHWYLFSPKNVKYPPGFGTYETQKIDAEIKLIPDKTILVNNQDPQSQPSKTAFGNDQTQRMMGIAAAYIFCVNHVQPDVIIGIRKEARERFMSR